MWNPGIRFFIKYLSHPAWLPCSVLGTGGYKSESDRPTSGKEGDKPVTGRPTEVCRHAEGLWEGTVD